MTSPQGGFDPYHAWLGIPPQERPISYYRLLGLRPFESNPQVIEAAVDQRLAFLRTKTTGPQASYAEQLINQIVQARLTLLDPVRKQAYGPIAMTRLAQGASGAAVQLLLGLLRLGPIGLIVGQVVGQAAGSSSLASRVLRLDAPTLSRVRPRAMLAAARRYDRFPKYSTAGALLNSSSLQLPSVLLTAYFGAAVAGWYFFAQRLLRSPLNMVANAVSQVYYGQAPRLARDNPRGLLTLFQRTARRLLLVGAVPLGLLAAVGPWAFATLFGDRWTAAGVYAQLLAPYLLFQFAFGPVSQTFSILEAQRAMLLLNASRMLLSVGPVVAAGRLGLSPETAVLTHSLGLATNYVMAYVVCSRLIRHRIEAHAGSGAGRS